MIGIEELRKQRENILQQRDNAFAVYNQSVGALMLLDHLLSQSEQPAKDALSLEVLRSLKLLNCRTIKSVIENGRSSCLRRRGLKTIEHYFN